MIPWSPSSPVQARASKSPDRDGVRCTAKERLFPMTKLEKHLRECPGCAKSPFADSKCGDDPHPLLPGTPRYPQVLSHNADHTGSAITGALRASTQKDQTTQRGRHSIYMPHLSETLFFVSHFVSICTAERTSPGRTDRCSCYFSIYSSY